MVSCGTTIRRVFPDIQKAYVVVSAMAAPSLAIQPAMQFAQTVVKVLSTDIVKFEGKFYRRVRFKEPRTSKDGSLLLTKTGRIRMRTVTRMEPIDVAVSLNPIGLGVLGILGALAGVVLVGRVEAAGFTIYEGPLANQFDAWKARRKDTQALQACLAQCASIFPPGSGRLACEATCRAAAA